MSDHTVILDTESDDIEEWEILPFVPENDSGLVTPTKPFDFTDPPENPYVLASSLFQTMFKYKGIGLAANQVGKEWSVFTVGAEDSNKQVFFNPEILEVSKEIELDLEGCLSYNKIFLKVWRPKWVKIKWQHVDGVEHTETFAGLTARIILHEMDHLLGKRWTDKVGSLALKIARDRKKKFEKKLARMKKNEIDD